MGPYLGQRHTLDILTARPVTFAYGHLFRAVHDGGDHDQYIVHYGGEDQYVYGEMLVDHLSHSRFQLGLCRTRRYLDITLVAVVSG